MLNDTTASLRRLEQMLTCRHCGSHRVIRKGSRNRRNGAGYIAFCRSCESYFTLNPSRTRVNPAEASTVFKEFTGGKSLRELAKQFSTSKTTIFRKIEQELGRVPGWEAVTGEWLRHYRERFGDWFRNLVMDTTTLKVAGEKLLYLHATDNYFKLPLVYKILQTSYEDSELIQVELEKLKELGYSPIIATVDGSSALITAIRRVYGQIPIQLCLFHLSKNLDKKLKVKEDTPIEFALARERARNLILSVACADGDTRAFLLAQLKNFGCCHDPKAMNAINDFVRNLQYYHVLEDLNGHVEALTTNICENHIGQIKNDLRGRLFGFKSRKTAEKHIDAYWLNYVRNNQRGMEWRREDNLSSFLLRGHIPLQKLAEVLRVDYDNLTKNVARNGAVIVQTIGASYPVSTLQINRVLKLAAKIPTVGELADIMALNPQVVYNIIKTYGKRMQGYSVYVESKELRLTETETEEILRTAKIRTVCQTPSAANGQNKEPYAIDYLHTCGQKCGNILYA